MERYLNRLILVLPCGNSGEFGTRYFRPLHACKARRRHRYAVAFQTHSRQKVILKCTLRQIHKDISMVDGRKKNVQKIMSADFQAGCVDAGMTANILMMIDHGLINQKLHLVFVVIH